MSQHFQSRQEEQVNQIIEKILQIVGKPLKISDVTGMIGKVIHMRETGASSESVIKQISGVTGMSLNDPRIEIIISEIEEKPFQNSYFPFQNSILDQIKKDLESN
ncbi:MAG: hypothetical protein WCL00_10910 [Bacteroidota bacterium]